MGLPFSGPIEPMLAKLASKLPDGDGWLHEPKWDGFRAIVFKDGDFLEMQSRDLKPLARYFPELLGPMHAQLPARCVLDGEIVIARDGRLDFESLLLRIHPAESRIKMLSESTPASYVAWDLLALDDTDLRARPLSERRATLERILAEPRAPLFVTPATQDRARAQDWFERFEGAGFDGVVSKQLTSEYSAGKRTMVKTKHVRSADCVLAGYRTYKGHKDAIGSFMLGLYDDAGALHSVGICAAFTLARRKELFAELQPLGLTGDARAEHPWSAWAAAQLAADAPAGDGAEAARPQRRPGMTSRWNRGKDLSWTPLKIERVVEVKYDHLQGGRFRHATHFLRWRPDKQPRDCTYAQLESTAPQELAEIFGSASSAKGTSA